MNLFNAFAALVISVEFAPAYADRGPAQISYRERLRRVAYNFAGNRVTFRSPELEALQARRALAIRCEVYQERAGIVGRAVF